MALPKLMELNMVKNVGRNTPVGVSSIRMHGGIYTMPIVPLVARINRKLHEQIPYREIYYIHTERGYFVRVTGGDMHNQTHGPYKFEHLVGLADYVNAFRRHERGYRPLQLVTRSGYVTEQRSLPDHLKFDFTTPLLQAAMEKLSEAGYRITRARGDQALRMPDGDLLGVTPLHGVTAPVATDNSRCSHGTPFSHTCGQCDAFFTEILGEIREHEEQEKQEPSPPLFVDLPLPDPPPPPVFGSSVATEDDA